jgi:hypothetical protein
MLGILCISLLAVSVLSAAPEIRWLEDHTAVEVTSLDEGALPAAGASADEWARRFPVRTATDAPAMLGKWSVNDGTVRFTPRFPFSAGLTYEAVWQPVGGKAVASRHLVPRRGNVATTVSHIFPGADTVPENLLKFYIHFSAPMSRGDVYQHLHLRRADGGEVELPFLELAEELWNPDMTRLTVFIDPGRVKREVKPLQDIGPALVAGQDFTLAIDAALPDATGQPLKQTAEKKFRVAPPDRTPPDPRQWKLTPAAAGTRDPLVLTFPEPLDHALALRLITIPDTNGMSAMSDDGTRWTYTPQAAWKAGPHTILVQPEFLVQPELEDLAGNSVGKPFEVDIAGTDKEKDRPVSKPVELPFTVR